MPEGKTTDERLPESHDISSSKSTLQNNIPGDQISSVPKSLPGQYNAPQIVAPDKNMPVKSDVKNTEQNHTNSTNIHSDDPVDVISIHATETSGKAPFTAILWARGSGSDYTWSPGDGSADVMDKNLRHTYEKAGSYTATLKAKDESGKTVTSQVTIVVTNEIEIDIPNIFTPNQDGKNDVFKVISGNLIEIEATIFDKSGRKVYQWNGVDGGWDGKLSSGENAQEGTYFYHIFATGTDYKKHSYKGPVRLMR
jgi:gliding motility-associated-like protein